MNVAEKQEKLEQMIEVLEYIEICRCKIQNLKEYNDTYTKLFGVFANRQHEIEITTNAMHRFAERYAKLKKVI